MAPGLLGAWAVLASAAWVSGETLGGVASEAGVAEVFTGEFAGVFAGLFVFIAGIVVAGPPAWSRP
ncbi:hypothetical protein D3C85_1378950 [compost metagenome]